MEKIEFRNIDSVNINDLLELDAGDNGKYVASNKMSIKQLSFPFKWIRKGIYQSNIPVGFIMYKFSSLKHELYLCRFMIDKKYQGRGLGIESLNEVRNIANREKGIRKIKLSTSPNNERGILIYKKFGFKDMERMNHGEKIFELIL